MFGKKTVKIKKESNRIIVDYGHAINEDFFADYRNELNVNEWVVMIDTNFVPNHSQHMVDEWILETKDWLDNNKVLYRQSRSVRQNTSIMGSLTKLGKKGEDYQYKIVFLLPNNLIGELINRYDEINMIHHMGIGLLKESIYDDFTSGMIDASNVLDYVKTDLYHHKQLSHLTIIEENIDVKDVKIKVEKIARY